MNVLALEGEFFGVLFPIYSGGETPQTFLFYEKFYKNAVKILKHFNFTPEKFKNCVLRVERVRKIWENRRVERVRKTGKCQQILKTGKSQ